jgi:uncharacterized protein YbjT (DUF2867 family)
LKVLLTGATGLIGSAIRAQLLHEGHQVIAVARSLPHAGLDEPNLHWLPLDFARVASAGSWDDLLRDIDAVVNCAGILQDGPGEQVEDVHARGLSPLFAACEARRIRVIHFSAIGVDRETPSEFSSSKRRGDEDLMRRDLPWVILRPSVVLGRAANGGSALFRGLAGLPLLPRAAAAGEIQAVQMADVVRTVMFFLPADAPSRLVLELAGPERLSFDEIVQTYRRWLGWRPSRSIAVPQVVWSAMYRLGDFAALLGWRSPVRSNARRELVRGAVGDPQPWTALTGIRPQSLRAALAAEPASVQERWFARMFFLKPLVFAVFALFWLGTGLISLGPGYRIGLSLMQEGGAGMLSGPSVIAGALADIAVGLGIAWRRTTRIALFGALALTCFYVVAGTSLLPRLWADPLGPMWKIWPIVMFNLIALAILDER